MDTENLTLEYWKDGDWYVGQIVGMLGIMSQRLRLQELKENIRDAYELMLEE